MRRLALATFVALAGAGCAHEYAYRPVDAAGAGVPAARYPIPPEFPRGEAYLTSFGFTSMEVAEGRTAEMLHARLVVSNGGIVPWTVDGRAQQLLAAGTQPALMPAFINTDAAGGGPVYAVPPSQRRVFDFYYAVPPPLGEAPQLGAFELSWRVDVAGRPITGRTPFQRFEGGGGAYDMYPDYVFVSLGFGPAWWYGPLYPYGYRPVIRNYYYPPARVRTSGTWHGTPRTPPSGGGWHGSPPSGGSPAPRPSGGAWRGRPR
jgi:hypothetical protein